MSLNLPRLFLQFGTPSRIAGTTITGFPRYHLILAQNKRKFTATATPLLQKSGEEQLLVVVGGGAAGVYGAIRAKTLAPNLNVLVIEKGKPLSKVKISGGGRCNVTNGHCSDNMVLAENYPRGHRELRGSFFNTHGPMDTMSWFVNRGVALKTEDDGRVFPVSNSSSSIIDCLLSEAKHRGVSLQTGKTVANTSVASSEKFVLKIEKRSVDLVEYVEADYLLIASGSSRQGYTLATQLGHSIVDPVPSLFTFKIEDSQLAELAGVTFPKVEAKLKLENVQRKIPHLKQGLSGDTLWASVPNNSLISIAHLLKNCTFVVKGKGQFKDEFVTAGGVPLSEVSLKTMESKICPRLFFAGEVLNVDGVTGGFNFQTAWSGGYIAGTSIGELAVSAASKEGVL